MNSNACNCVVSYCTKYKNIIHTCLECKSNGGSTGNVNHNNDCQYINCNHCKNYGTNIYDNFFKNHNKNEQTNFKQKLNQHIKDGNKIIYNNQLKKVNKIIERKTGVSIFHFSKM